MISDENIKQLFQNGQGLLAKRDKLKPLPTQFYRGRMSHTWENQHPGNCERHMSLFLKASIIPEYCFGCYKILIEPRTVVELFKLMVVFERIKLPDDNTRKCIVEGREKVTGTYKGYIYCRGRHEGNVLTEIFKKIVSEEISSEIPISLKRGCSEYALVYPEFAQLENSTSKIQHSKEWQEQEALFDSKSTENHKPPVTDTYNQPGYTLYDAEVMLAWLKYAATIGDKSYLNISSGILQPFQGLKRPPIVTSD